MVKAKAKVDDLTLNLHISYDSDSKFTLAVSLTILHIFTV